jgi:hypothetical protein
MKDLCAAYEYLVSQEITQYRGFEIYILNNLLDIFYKAVFITPL